MESKKKESTFKKYMGGFLTLPILKEMFLFLVGFIIGAFAFTGSEYADLGTGKILSIAFMGAGFISPFANMIFGFLKKKVGVKEPSDVMIDSLSNSVLELNQRNLELKSTLDTSMEAAYSKIDELQSINLKQQAELKSIESKAKMPDKEAPAKPTRKRRSTKKKTSDAGNTTSNTKPSSGKSKS